MIFQALYVDKLDEVISRDFYEQKNSEWRLDQDKILRKIDKHQNANQSYLDEGVRLLELSQNAVRLYEKQEMREKRRILNFVLSNSIWKNGRLYPNYRQPFDMLAETNLAYQKEKAVSPQKNGLFDIWLPLVDALRNQFSAPSKEMIYSCESIQEVLTLL
jgi:site-specific DNA recombinase